MKLLLFNEILNMVLNKFFMLYGSLGKKRRKKVWIFLRYFPSKKCHPSGGDDAWPTPNPTIELICHLTTAHHYIVRVCSEKKLDSLGKNVKLQHEMKNIFFLKIFKVCKLMRDGFFFQTDFTNYPLLAGRPNQQQWNHWQLNKTGWTIVWPETATSCIV